MKREMGNGKWETGNEQSCQRCGCWLKYGQSGTAMTNANTTPAPYISIIVRNDDVRYPVTKLNTAKSKTVI